MADSFTPIFQMSTTEQPNPLTAQIDTLSTIEALTLINAEDKKVAIAVERVLPAIATAVDAIVVQLRRGGRLFYVGTGTSGRLGVLDAAECPPTFGVSPDLVQGIIAGGYEACYKAVEASEDDRDAGAEDLKTRGVNERDAVIGIAASGGTPYTIGAVTYARGIGAFTACITCNEYTALAAAVELPIEPIVGPEVIAGSTRLKSGTAQKLVLNMLSTMTMVRLGYVKGNRMSNVQTKNIKLRERAVGILQSECGLESEAARLLLEASDWKLPVALVMQQAKVSPAAAEAALQKNGNSVVRAVADLAR
jgi:N-acetylmuramic acid 6-phosphate etherase